MDISVPDLFIMVVIVGRGKGNFQIHIYYFRFTIVELRLPRWGRSHEVQEKGEAILV